MKYSPEIDGLRAIAVLLVALFHAGASRVKGGFVGVDVFFVISGFLITRSILNDFDTNSFSLRYFYERRIRRIVPPLIATIFVTFMAAYVFLLPTRMSFFLDSVFASLGFYSNIFFAAERGYFDRDQLAPLLHTWSLSIEEQYYLLYPLLMLMFAKRSRMVLGIILLTLACASFGYSEWLVETDRRSAYFSSMGRIWEILVGCLVALIPTENDRLIKSKNLVADLMCFVGLAAIFLSAKRFDVNTSFPGIAALAPVFGAAIIIRYSGSTYFVSKLLSLPPLVLIGKCSYGIYLFHYPLSIFTISGLGRTPTNLEAVMLATLAVGIGILSWYLFERPFKIQSWISSRATYALCGITVAILIVFAATGKYTNGFNFRLLPDGTKYANLDSYFKIDYGVIDGCVQVHGNPVYCATNQEPEILVWGDSYAMHLVPGILASKPDAKVLQSTFSSCPPYLKIAPHHPTKPHDFVSKCLKFNDRTAELITNTPSIRYVVLSSFSFKSFGLSSIAVDGENKRVATRMTTDLLTETIKFIKSHGKIPVVFSPIPQNGANLGQCIALRLILGMEVSECNMVRNDVVLNQKDLLSVMTKAAEMARVVSFADYLCAGDKCLTHKESIIYYRDGTHLTTKGSQELGKQMNFYELITRKNSSESDIGFSHKEIADIAH